MDTAATSVPADVAAASDNVAIIKPVGRDDGAESVNSKKSRKSKKRKGSTDKNLDNAEVRREASQSGLRPSQPGLRPR